jgi:hypothetical protein
LVPASVKILKGQKENTFTVAAIDNTIVDGNKAVQVTITAPNYKSAATTITIIDNDAINPPQPNIKFQVMFFMESGQLDNLSDAQRNMLASLVFRDGIRQKGHVLVGIWDKDLTDPNNKIPERYKPYFDVINGKTLPRICIAPVDGGTIQDYPLPADEAGFWALLTGGK